jgi:hypothetical protein
MGPKTRAGRGPRRPETASASGRRYHRLCERARDLPHRLPDGGLVRGSCARPGCPPGPSVVARAPAGPLAPGVPCTPGPSRLDGPRAARPQARPRCLVEAMAARGEPTTQVDHRQPHRGTRATPGTGEPRRAPPPLPSAKPRLQRLLTRPGTSRWRTSRISRLSAPDAAAASAARGRSAAASVGRCSPGSMSDRWLERTSTPPRVREARALEQIVEAAVTDALGDDQLGVLGRRGNRDT